MKGNLKKSKSSRNPLTAEGAKEKSFKTPPPKINYLKIDELL